MKIRLSGTRDYKYVIADVDRHGKVRLYFRRRPEPKVLLKEAPGSAAFEAEYLKAYAGEIVVPPAGVVVVTHGPALAGTMRWLVEKLDGETRKVRRRILDRICERAGGLAFAALEPRHIAKLRDEKADTPEAANSYVKAMRALFKWACHPEYKLATKNPAKDVSYLDAGTPDGHRTWTEAEVAQFEACYPLGTKARVSFDLFQYTGVRISDAVRLGPQMERPHPQWGSVLVFTEHKGRARAVKAHEMPILPPLRASIDAYRATAGQGGQHLVYLPTAFGKPHSVKGFGNWFVDQCRRAGLDQGLSAHGLRKIAAVRFAEAGASEHQLMAWFGWTSPKQAGPYTKKADRARMEGSAAALLLQRTEPTPAQTENKIAANSGEKVQPF